MKEDMLDPDFRPTESQQELAKRVRERRQALSTGLLAVSTMVNHSVGFLTEFENAKRPAPNEAFVQQLGVVLWATPSQLREWMSLFREEPVPALPAGEDDLRSPTSKPVGVPVEQPEDKDFVHFIAYINARNNLNRNPALDHLRQHFYMLMRIIDGVFSVHYGLDTEEDGYSGEVVVGSISLEDQIQEIETAVLVLAQVKVAENKKLIYPRNKFGWPVSKRRPMTATTNRS